MSKLMVKIDYNSSMSVLNGIESKINNLLEGFPQSHNLISIKKLINSLQRHLNEGKTNKVHDSSFVDIENLEQKI